MNDSPFHEKTPYKTFYLAKPFHGSMHRIESFVDVVLMYIGTTVKDGKCRLLLIPYLV